MSHARKQIRDYIVNLLNSNSILTYSSRKLPVDVLPVTGVYAEREDLNLNNDAQQYYHIRELNLIIRSIVKGVNIDDTMDIMASSIETVLLNDEFLANKCYSTDLSSTEMQLDPSSESEKGLLTMSFLIKYITEKGKPEIILK